MRGAAYHDNKSPPGSEVNNAGLHSHLESARDDIGEDEDGLGHGNVIIGSEKKWPMDEEFDIRARTPSLSSLETLGTPWITGHCES